VEFEVVSAGAAVKNERMDGEERDQREEDVWEPVFCPYREDGMGLRVVVLHEVKGIKDIANVFQKSLDYQHFGADFLI